MANHASAEKRHTQSLKKQQANRWWKSRVKTAVRNVTDATKASDEKKAGEELRKAASELHKAGRKGIIHKNTASRKLARLSKAIAKLSAH